MSRCSSRLIRRLTGAPRTCPCALIILSILGAAALFADQINSSMVQSLIRKASSGSDATTPTLWRSYRVVSSSSASTPSINVNVCGHDVRNSPLGSERDCSNLPWPRRGGRNRRRSLQQSLCPWPSIFGRAGSQRRSASRDGGDGESKAGALVGAGFVNFTAASARRLLRGRTVFVNGDSTSRRLMWSLCNFLDSDGVAFNASAHAMSGGGCCGTNRVDIHCNLPSVLGADIMLEYNAPLLYRDLVLWVEGGGVSKARNLRNPPPGVGLPSVVDARNSIPPGSMPRSREPRSVHIFHPVAGTWHSCHRDGDSSTTTDLDGWTNATCGMNRFAGTRPHQLEVTACKLVRRFCPRFEDAAGRQLPRKAYRRKGGPVPVHMHGLTNILAYASFRSGKGKRNKLKHGDDRNQWNRWMLTVAQATHHFNVDDGDDDGDDDGRGSNAAKACMADTMNHVDYDLFAPRTYIHEDGISCGFHDQTSWMAEPSMGAKRLDCMPSDGFKGIHIYNEQAQLMRVQLLLNQILRTEEGWGPEI